MARDVRKPPKGLQAQLLRAMSPGAYADESLRWDDIVDALESGATPNDYRVQKAWIGAQPTWLDASIHTMFGESLKAQPGLPLEKALKAGAWDRLGFLLAHGLSAQELGNALLDYGQKLPSPGLDLIARVISEGFSPSLETVLSKTVEVEDDGRALLLAEGGLLDPNAIVPDLALEGGSGQVSYAQSILFYGREVDLARWLELGADFSRPFPGGRNLATQMLLGSYPSVPPGQCPIPEFRARHLLELARMGLVDWASPDGHGETGIQAFRALPHSDHPYWVELETLACAQVMEARLPPAEKPHPSRRF